MRFLLILALLAAVVAGSSCSRQASSSTDEVSASSRSLKHDDSAEEDEEQSLEDGTHDCVATNIDTGHGPYTLECDKSGDEVRVTFPNGGWRTVDIDSIEQTGDKAFRIEGTDRRKGEMWEIEIEQ